MDTWAITLIITLVLGFIIGNLMLLKHSANMKLPDKVLQEIKKKKEEEELKNKSH